jgi:adenine phosphoribosyltransferase
MTKLSETKKKIFAIEILQLLKKEYSYNELSKMLDLPIPVISRYINGHVLPNIKRTDKILNFFKEEYLIEMIKSKIKIKENGIFDLSSLVHDTMLQRIVGKTVFHEFEIIDIDKILTVETNGIPLAVQIGNEFGVDVIIAKKQKELGIDEFIEEKSIVSPSVGKFFYIPKDSIKKDDLVLIVDDIIRTGVTISGLIKLIEKAKAKPAGIFTLISTKDAIENLKKTTNIKCQVSSLLIL